MKLIGTLKILALTGTLAAADICWSADEVLARSQRDEYTKSTGIATKNYPLPKEDVKSSFFNVSSAYATLTGKVADTGKEGFALRVFYRNFDGWALLSVAHDSDGADLPVDIINREVQSGREVTEEISVLLTRDYLMGHVNTGLDLRIDGKSGRIFVRLPSSYVESFLKHLTLVEADTRARLSSLPPASPAPHKLGIGFRPVDITNAQFLGLSAPKGIVIGRVDPGSPAELSGLKIGDVILSVNAQSVPSTLTGLQAILGTLPSGNVADFLVWRANGEIHLLVQL